MRVELVKQNLEALDNLIRYTKQKYEDHIARLVKQKEAWENELRRNKSGNRGDEERLNEDVTSDRIKK